MEKNVKNICRYYPFTHVHHKSRSYHVQPKKSKFWKTNKHSWRLSFSICVPQMTIIWCMVPEISSTTNRISSHFGLFFALLPLLTIQKIKILKKWKKTPGRYYHFPHEHHKSKLYMIPEIWSKTDIIFSLPFYPSPPFPPA